MSETLANTEVGARLSPPRRQCAASTDAVQPYDFRRPRKLAKDPVRALELIHERFARLLSTTLATQLRTQTLVTLAGIDQIPYDEFLHALPNPTVLVTFAFAAETGNALLEIDPGLATALVDRLLGGKGDPLDQPRELTEIERALVARIAGLALHDLGAAWRSLVEVSPTLQEVGTSTLSCQIALPGEVVMVITFAVTLGGVSGTARLCLPVAALQPVAGRLSAEQWFAAAQGGRTEEGSSAISEQLHEAPLICRAILGRASLRVADLAALEVGDVICLDTRPGQEFPLYIGDQAKLLGLPGLLGRRYALQITRPAYDPTELPSNE
ncbi:MAG: flagellar motor switch protein FliM [Armatimonadetes bacterium]|nr:flagellar motor switch protein FliM [Armatimonadota bacterium]